MKKKKTTLVHKYKDHYSWHGHKYAANSTGVVLLACAITNAGFIGIRFNDHRKRKKVVLMSRESM